MQNTKTVRRKKTAKRVVSGVAHVHATFNNTIVTVTDQKGEVLCWASAGTSGFKGSRKSTPFAASVAAKEAARKARLFGVMELNVTLNGPGPGKESALRSLRSEGFNVKDVREITPTPHNGCRQKKRRRI